MKSMKKCLVVAALLLSGIPTAWADSVQELTINGEKVEKTVARITFDGDNAVLTFADATQQAADMSQVVLAFKPSQATAIYQLKTAAGSQLNMGGLEPGTKVVVYNAAGKTVMTATAGKDAAMQLNIQALPRGVYVMQAGNRVVKFNK